MSAGEKGGVRTVEAVRRLIVNDLREQSKLAGQQSHSFAEIIANTLENIAVRVLDMDLRVAVLDSLAAPAGEVQWHCAGCGKYLSSEHEIHAQDSTGNAVQCGPVIRVSPTAAGGDWAEALRADLESSYLVEESDFTDGWNAQIRAVLALLARHAKDAAGRMTCYECGKTHPPEWHCGKPDAAGRGAGEPGEAAALRSWREGALPYLRAFLESSGINAEDETAVRALIPTPPARQAICHPAADSKSEGVDLASGEPARQASAESLPGTTACSCGIQMADGPAVCQIHGPARQVPHDPTREWAAEERAAFDARPARQVAGEGEPGWLGRQFDSAQREIDASPPWMYDSPARQETRTNLCPACGGNEFITEDDGVIVCRTCGEIRDDGRAPEPARQVADTYPCCGRPVERVWARSDNYVVPCRTCEPARQVARELGNFADSSTGTATPECAVCHEPATCKRHIKAVNREVALCKDCEDMHVQQLRDESTAAGKQIWRDVDKAAARAPGWIPGARQVAREEQGEQTININDMVRIVVRARGVKAWNDFYVRLNLEPRCRFAPGDTYKAPLWEIMNIFGSACYMGPETPFNTEMVLLNGRAQPTRSAIAAKVVEALLDEDLLHKSRIEVVEFALTAMRVGRED